MAQKKTTRIFYTSLYGDGTPIGYVACEDFGRDAFTITFYQYQRIKQKVKRLTGHTSIRFYTGKDIYILNSGNVCYGVIKRGVINE